MGVQSFWDTDPHLPLARQAPDDRIALKAGCSAIAPPADCPRLEEMRSGLRPDMWRYCGKECEVVRVRGSQVQLRLKEAVSTGKIQVEGGDESWWDIDVMPDCNQRVCHRGCELQRWNGPGMCDVCHAHFPKGGESLRCQEHNYDVCTFCECLASHLKLAVALCIVSWPTTRHCVSS